MLLYSKYNIYDGGENGMNFGEYFYSLRVKSGLTLRKFAEKIEEDPAYISRLERGKVRAPKSHEKLGFFATELGLRKNTKQFDKFIQLAEISNRSYGVDSVKDERILEKLPVFLRTLDNKGLDESKLDDLIKAIEEEW